MTNTNTKIQILRDALTAALNEKCDYMKRKKLGDPEIEEVTIMAREALRLTEGAQDAPGEAVYFIRQKTNTRGDWLETSKATLASMGGRVRECFDIRILYTHPAPTPTAEAPAPKASTEPVGCDRHPIQPLIKDVHGCDRFKANKIVQHLLDHSGIDMNALACIDFPTDDREQFAQLIGYSLSGFGDLSYVTDETYESAAASIAQPASTEPAPSTMMPSGLSREEMRTFIIASAQPVAEHAKRAEFSGEREALFDEFLREEAPLDYDASNSDAWHIWQAAWQARGQQQAGVPGGWISVEDRLPDVGQHVVAFRPTAHITEDPPICITFYRGQMKRDWQDVEHGFDCLCHPSHWMPIPAAPTAPEATP